jgi:hypothetical protein
MTINQDQFKNVALEAKTKTNDRRWQRAIDNAVAGVTSGWWIITELFDSIAVTTETGKTYFANGSCQCRAYELGQPCKHRALARLIELYNERSSKILPSHSDLINDIETIWPTKFPTVNLADELMARFKKNSLEMLSIDFLLAIRAIIA